ncbi:sulfatase [Crateriforma conspicua]|uniref:sulfatase n=1 Tax=Crateriforma conspicua TaxID=2527996 RepID=UPI0013FD0DF2|nr:sulfatase [Crateriforma conspicua]
MNRLSQLLLLAVFLTCLGKPSHAEQNAGTDHPNVLFIAVDDLNNWLGCAGHEQAITPNIDRLASRGTYFSRAYCAYPLCGPSRASLMSGIHFADLNTTKLQPKDSEVQQRVEAMGSSLLHTYLGDRGYETMAVGKILHRHVPTRSVDLSGGRGNWDFIHGEDGKRTKINFPSNKTLTDWAEYPYDEAEMSDSLAARWAVDRLDETHEKPFMLMVGFLRPHVPWYVPKKYFDMYDAAKLTLPEYRPDDFDDLPQAALEQLNEGYPRTQWAIENNQWRNMVHAYLASITFADTKVGEVLDALDASPYKDNTIVVLWSDHGYHMGEKNTFQKHTPWNRSGVAPLFISAPGMGAGQTCDRVVSLLDIYPTLVDLCGLPPNEKVIGRSLKPLLKNPKHPWNHPALTFKRNFAAVQDGSLRLIRYEDGSLELYDHASDPHEWNNLANNPEHALTINKLQKLLATN